MRNLGRNDVVQVVGGRFEGCYGHVILSSNNGRARVRLCGFGDGSSDSVQVIGMKWLRFVTPAEVPPGIEVAR